MSALKLAFALFTLSTLVACGGGSSSGSAENEIPAVDSPSAGTPAADNESTPEEAEEASSDTDSGNSGSPSGAESGGNSSDQGSTDESADTNSGDTNGSDTNDDRGSPAAPGGFYSDEVALALATADARFVQAPAALLNAAIKTIDRDAALSSHIQRELFEDLTATGPIDWHITHDAALLGATFGLNAEILLTNQNNKGEALNHPHAVAVAGTKDQGRYLVFGGNPLRPSNKTNEGMQQLLRNSVQWLSGTAQPKKVVLAHLGDSYWFRDEPSVRAWLNNTYGDAIDINEQDACNNGALKACLSTNIDLLVISQVGGDDVTIPRILEAIKFANSQGVGLLYVHHDGNLTPLGAAIFSHLNIRYAGDNYWPKETVVHMYPESLYDRLPTDIASIKTTLEHLRDDSFSFDIKNCDNGCGNIPAFTTEFANGTRAMRDLLDGFDKRGENIFVSYTSDAIKLALLYADALRQKITYPLTPGETSRLSWLSAYYADHAVHVTRDFVPAQKDLGNFSRNNFDHITPTVKQVQLSPKNGFRAAGVYALPGTPVTVTRVDDSDVVTHVKVNSLRASSTHEWIPGEYKRPKFLSSQWLPLAKGEPLTFTSPYGGPVQVKFNDTGADVELAFEQVGLHPFWASESDNDAFENALALGHFDWAELSTPGFEIHSKLEKMRQSASQADFPNATALAAGAMQYSHNYALLLAGYQGPGIDVVKEIHDFAARHGLSIYTVNTVKHMNADQPTCGAGCSGNPYDASWSYSPVGHGDLHEIGHGLERSRFRFPNWEGHTTTNPYSYYAKSRFHINTGKDAFCQKLPMRELFDMLKAAEQTANPMEYMRQQNLGSWNRGVGIYIQMMMGAQAYGELNNGWHLWARLHIIERAFSDALRSEQQWAAQARGLGFDGYSLTEAKNLNNTDFMLIALSHAAGLDYSNYFLMWGLAPTASAKMHVQAMQLPAMPKVFFAASEGSYCENFQPETINVAADAQWPEQ